MTHSEGVEVSATSATTGEITERERPTHYPISGEGRRQAAILLAGVATIWLAALWILFTILQDGIGGVEWVSLALMVGILVVAPVVGWALVEEATARITTDDQGIRYRAAGGIHLTYLWTELRGFEPRQAGGRLARFFLGSDGDTRDQHDRPGAAQREDGADINGNEREDSPPVPNERDTLLLQAGVDHTRQIPNPLVRFLHRQAYGTAIPIYAGLEGRDQLLAEVTAHLEPQSSD
jgi:hypothetical protein